MIRLFATIAFFGLVALSSQAHASLGGDSTTVDGDQLAIGGVSRTSIPKPGYTIEEITTRYGIVREYVNRDGKVFAVAWSGQSHPDLTPLLGNSYNEYRKAAAKQLHKHGHRHHQVTTPARVLVEHRGHMRKVEGRAVDPSLVPRGVSANEIQ